jgi:multisubunit Na+/H+ antiporter MnhF subunit
MNVLEAAVSMVFVSLSVSIILCVYRLWKGPTLPDRVVAADTITINVVALIALWCIKVRSGYAFDAVLVLSVLGFMATCTLAKYIARGDRIFD